MKPSVVHYVGVDIAKHEIVIAGPTLALRQSLPNTKAALIRWAQKMRARPESIHVVCEATGGYERVLMEVLWSEGLAVSRLNPRTVRHFAKARGLLAKTDAIDAVVLADFGAAFSPPTTPAPSEAQRRLAALVARREDLKVMRGAEVSRLEHLDDPSILKLVKKLLRQIDSQLAEVELLLARTVASDPALRSKVDRLTQIKGVGFITAVTLLASMPELGSLSRTAAAALAGVAPFNRDSGIFRGQRRIASGRPLARRALYMAALVASRSNPILKLFYQRLRLAGKPPKIILTAIMRKLIILLNSLLKLSPLPPSC